MDDEKSIEAAMWVMVFVQTIGSVDMPGSGQRKLPAPRAYVPIVVGFSILQLLADMGNTRAAKAMAWVLVATAVFLGPFGKKLIDFLDNTATFAQSNTASAVGPAGGTVGSGAASSLNSAANNLTPSVRSRNPVTSGTASAVQSTDRGIASVLKNLPF